MTDEIVLTDEELIECAGSLGPQVRLAWALVVSAGKHVALVELVRKKLTREEYVSYGTLDDLVERLLGHVNRDAASWIVERIYSRLRNKCLERDPQYAS